MFEEEQIYIQEVEQALIGFKLALDQSRRKYVAKGEEVNGYLISTGDLRDDLGSELEKELERREKEYSEIEKLGQQGADQATIDNRESALEKSIENFDRKFEAKICQSSPEIEQEDLENLFKDLEASRKDYHQATQNFNRTELPIRIQELMRDLYDRQQGVKNSKKEYNAKNSEVNDYINNLTCDLRDVLKPELEQELKQRYKAYYRIKKVKLALAISKEEANEESDRIYSGMIRSPGEGEEGEEEGGKWKEEKQKYLIVAIDDRFKATEELRSKENTLRKSIEDFDRNFVAKICQSSHGIEQQSIEDLLKDLEASRKNYFQATEELEYTENKLQQLKQEWPTSRHPKDLNVLLLQELKEEAHKLSSLRKA